MKLIKLTQGKYTLVDDIDFEYLNQWKWYTLNRGYAVRRIYKPKVKLILMHRIILERMGFKNFKQVDHMDGNKLNNRRSNLRVATSSQNQQHKIKTIITKSSRYKGVSYHRKRWDARISVNKRQVHIGCYTNEIEAAIAYNKAAKKYFGEFACLNKI